MDFISFRRNKPLGNSWLRSSRFMRAFYGGLKVLSFVLLAYLPEAFFVIPVVYLTIVVNFLRALPIFSEFLKQLK